ncbi:MAG: geranylgeranyl reductase family protein [Syntrophales bacterium]|jgi:geranylgeranyl reductase family protein|nr:geranylgeranyl reductase family protein [Syntrophales bacterium]MDY0045311.1 geranylgeranyl reductase family protein [Syntrophales bacterium]
MYDLIIAGGGPCGSSAGFKAAERGLKTLVIEKKSFPRYKPCAGGLTRRALKYLDFEIPERIKEKDIYGLRLCAKGKKVEKRSQSIIGITVTRSAFDDLLLNRAAAQGATINTCEKVLNIRDNGNHLKIVTDRGSYFSRYAIIAEGARGQVMRHSSGMKKKYKCALSLVAEIEAENHDIDDRLSGVFEIYLDFCQGYGWFFPHDNYYSVGIWGAEESFKDPKAVMRDFVKKLGFEKIPKMRGQIIPLKEPRENRGSRILSAGDAAGYIDPFLGEGISYAVISGKIAADTIADAVQKEGTLRQDLYTAACRNFTRNFGYARIMKETVLRFPSFFFDLAAANDSIAHRFLDIPAMKGQYPDFLFWLLPRIPKTLLSYYLLKIQAHGPAYARRT